MLLGTRQGAVHLEELLLWQRAWWTSQSVVIRVAVSEFQRRYVDVSWYIFERRFYQV